MVMRPTRVTRPASAPVMCPRLRPRAAKISENSEICATVSPARNPVRLRYPITPMITMTISGLPISTNNDSPMATASSKKLDVPIRAQGAAIL